MQSRKQFALCTTILFSLFFFFTKSFSQCSVQTGAPPPNSAFETGSPDQNLLDKKWLIAQDSITGLYKPANVMQGLVPLYHNPLRWISFSATGEHTGNRDFFFKLNFELPCFDSCGRSYNNDNSFCLSLDLYSDNSIFEIFVNGVPQSGNLGGIIPFANPYNPVHSQSDKTPVTLCKNWKAGANTIIIQVASSATVAGLEAEAAVNPPPPPDSDSVEAVICEGETLLFAGKTLTQSGYYFHSFDIPGGCDSNVVLHLDVKPKARDTIDQSICEGEQYLGYTQTGTYTDSFPGSNGCDSIRVLNLTVQEKPRPDLGNRKAICGGDSIVLAPGPFDTYLWQDGSTNNYFIVRQPGLYTLTATNHCGSGSAQIQIKEGVCGEYFPTAFTPNNDGKNDFFKILTNFALQDYHLEVYSRWGQKIFESTDPIVGWDGSYNGKPLQSGLFVWKCTYKKSNTDFSRKGTVTLIR